MGMSSDIPYFLPTASRLSATLSPLTSPL
jgi:hypothetical protein